jgi:hypothetical protein
MMVLKANPERKCVKENYFAAKPATSVSGYNGEIYEGDVDFSVFDE